jgi:hypothetical protein
MRDLEAAYIARSLETEANTRPEMARQCELHLWLLYWILKARSTALSSAISVGSHIITTKPVSELCGGGCHSFGDSWHLVSKTEFF